MGGTKEAKNVTIRVYFLTCYLLLPAITANFGFRQSIAMVGF